MTHDSAWDIAVRALDEPLSLQERQHLDTHLATCAECRPGITALSLVHDTLRVERDATPVGAMSDAVRVQRRSTLRRYAAVAAAVVLALISGYAAGQRQTSIAATATAPAAAGLRTFVFLLEEPQSPWPPPAPLARTGYAEWVHELRAAGRFNVGDRLREDDGRYLGTDRNVHLPAEMPARRVNYSGFFQVRARDYDDAIALARRGPHLAHGGILIREVHP